VYGIPLHATQRNATQRNATQRNATQRNATQRNATHLSFSNPSQVASFSSVFPDFLHFHQNQLLIYFIAPLRYLHEVRPP
jgi:threonine/homoserine/homoserine lactone efflux protein